MRGVILPALFYARPTLQVARSLLGKYLVRETAAGLREGRIIEVEAYVGPEDRASHASRGRTNRTEVMFGPPGLAYVYMIYGMYHCLNVVTERIDYPAAVLIRAVEHEAGLADGPGRVCRVFEIDRQLNYHDLTSGKAFWIEDRGEQIRRTQIGAFPRIGVDYAGPWAAKPWRFRLIKKK
jgi:DNA-3-methyladenine glycosylase